MTTKALTVREQARADFAKLIPKIQTVLPRGVGLDRFKTIALGVLNRKDLQPCLEKSPFSVFGAIMQAAQLGLMPNGLAGEAHILPFKVKGVPTATFIPGYRGYMTLGWRSGQIESFDANVVYERDAFSYHYDTTRQGHVLVHTPYMGAEEPGVIRAAYAVAVMKSGHRLVVVLPRRDIDRARASSKQSEGMAWSQWFPEMAMKTALRRLARLMPMSSELQLAGSLDDQSAGGSGADLSELVEDVLVDDAREVEVEEPETKVDKIKGKLKKASKKDEEDPPQDEGRVEVKDDDNPFAGWDGERST